jgi:ketosteroid isomerase-like protein
MALKNQLLVLALILFGSNSTNLKAKSLLVDENQKVVLDYVEAFNQKKIELMLEHTTEDILWMSLVDDNVSVETKGKNALKQALLSYFKSTPSIHSEILKIHVSGPFAYTVEKAHWKSQGKAKSQCSPAMYQFEYNKISHVWYFKSYDC